MFFKKNKTQEITDISNIKEKNIFIIQNAFSAMTNYIITGKCAKGYFSTNDIIKIQEHGCDISEGYINQIKTFDRIDIENTYETENDKNLMLYVTLKDTNEHIKITNKNFIVN